MDFELPPFSYKDIESDYILEELEECDFDDLKCRKHVNKLMYVEQYIKGKSEAYINYQITEKILIDLSEEYDEIEKELNPFNYSQRRKREKRELQDLEDMQKELSEEKKQKLKKAKREWKEVKKNR